MIEIKLEETHKLTLEMNIEGDVKKEDTQLRFSIMAEGVRYSFDSHQREKGIYDIQFPAMLGKLEEGVYEAEVEVILENNKYFAPLREQVKFTKEIKPTVKLAETIAQMAPLSISVSKIKVTETISINDVKSLFHAVSNDDKEMDTTLALRCLNSMALAQPLTESALSIVPTKALSEAEAIAAIRVLKKHGLDMTDVSPMDGLVGLSQRTKEEVIDLLSIKGISAKKLRGIGL